MQNNELTAPLFGINRHRLATDGKGVTTLVAFHGCPLRCKYCLNPQCHESSMPIRTLTPSQLIDELMVDNLYFLATGGGVCFGGGEPLLHSRFIEQFCQLMVAEWKVTIETSLNVALTHLERVAPYIDQYIIDVKDINPDIYQAYTQCDNSQVTDNLRWLLQQGIPTDRIMVRLPHIPDHNTQEDIDRSRSWLAEVGITWIDEFDYIIR